MKPHTLWKVEKLRKLQASTVHMCFFAELAEWSQDLLDSEIGFFVIIVPATAIPVIAASLRFHSFTDPGPTLLLCEEPESWHYLTSSSSLQHCFQLWLEVGIKGATIAEARSTIGIWVVLPRWTQWMCLRCLQGQESRSALARRTQTAQKWSLRSRGSLTNFVHQN